MTKMPISDSYLQYVLEQLSPLGEVTAKRMFGGVGLFRDGLMFGLIADYVLYLKVDDSNRGTYQAVGMMPFRPGDKSPVMPYYQVPVGVMEDKETLMEWAQKSFVIAEQKAAEKGKKSPSKRSPGGR
jgi:DNA transformation protein